MNDPTHGGADNDAPRPLNTHELRSARPSRADFLSLPRTAIHLVLDGVSSAANVGNIFRLADALRAENLWICGSTVSLTSGRFRRAAKGITKWVPHTMADNCAQVVTDLKARGVHVVGIELTAASTGLPDTTFPRPLALVVGNESRGVSPEVLALCDGVVALPMLGMGNSINASNALAAVAYWALCKPSAGETGAGATKAGGRT